MARYVSHVIKIVMAIAASGCNPSPPSALSTPKTSPSTLRPSVSPQKNPDGIKRSEVQADASETTPVLINVSISPEARVKASAEEIAMELQRGIWREFLIKIDNAAGITAPLIIESDQLQIKVDESSRDRWLQLELEPKHPLTGERSEVRTLRMKSRDSGIRTAILNFNAGQGTQDLGFRSDVLITFRIHDQ